MSKIKRTYQAYYLKEEDIRKDGNIPILYTKPKTIIGYDDVFDMATFNARGINYQNINKKELMDNCVFLWGVIENLKRELASSHVTNQILTKRLAEHNLITSLTPDEIEQYEITLGAALKEKINLIANSETLPLAQELVLRVRGEIAKVDYETQSNFKYNIIRLNNILKLNDLTLEQLNNNKFKDLKSKDRLKLVLDTQKNTRETIQQLKEISRDIGLNIKEETKSYLDDEDDNEQQESNNTKKINLASFIGGKDGK